MRGGQDGIEGPRPLPSPEGPRSQHPGRKGKAPALPAQGRVLPAFQNQRGPEGGPRASLPQRGPWPGGWLHLLGFSADLVIVVNADGNKKEAAGQQQQDPLRHEPCLG